ncbi:MAG: serine/threonine protein kinase [Sandaracinus sp.]|nr:serine/threonine protein kinase [Sandaracinus sp.]MCB9620348.1 serine/threonine protein kinase [Sandaracinus sp.]
MRHRDYLDGLTQLHRHSDPAERRAAWRQSLATLAAAVADHRRTVPLEGLDPDELLASVEHALETRLVEDVEWLSAPAAAAALYELAAALPQSDAKRELGRRVLLRLRDGDAATFVALATQLALSSRRALAGAAMRARVALSLDLPLGSGVHADGLALALISRRDVSREWLAIPSTGGLPQRRLAARLLERAAREAGRRFAEGDSSGVRVFETEVVAAAWERLLGDRESLVWRHVATARGLLVDARPTFREEIERHLEPALGITEWRRAAASLAASIAVSPQEGLEACRNLLGSPIFSKDRGLAAAMVLGLPRAAEREPEAVEQLLSHLVRHGGLDVTEALVELRAERGEGFGEWAAKRAHAQLREATTQLRSKDDGQNALTEALLDELDPDPERPSLRDLVARALQSFVTHGAREASFDAQVALEHAEARVRELEAHTDDMGESSRRRAFRALRELDLALLESETLANLLALGSRGEEPGEEVRPLGDLFQRLTNWLVIQEGEPLRTDGSVAHPTLRMRRLRSLLHLVDSDGRRVDDRSDLLRQRRLLATQVLLRRLRDDVNVPLRRALCATAARACDAVVREDIVEVSDVLLVAGCSVNAQRDLVTMAEASMVPDLETALAAYARVEKAVATGPTGGRGVREAVEALSKLAHDLPVACSPRVEALRASLLELGRSLEPCGRAGSLREVAEETDGESPFASLEAAAGALAKLTLGARRRLGDSVDGDRSAIGPAVRYLDIHLDHALRGTPVDLGEAIESVADTLRDELPNALGQAVVVALQRVATLPLDAPRRSRPSYVVAAPREAALPAWMPPSRILGGFYVTRAIGNGAVGSVFVARRAESRHEPKAETFALKVPEYAGGAARTLSEGEFFNLFREEAGALLALPEHAHIARFVTFDAGARPKPILVMELVEGPSLERAIEIGALDMPRALKILDGVAGGLEAMHAKGIAHLDVKPSNVILREGDGLASEVHTLDQPVLVDFGLAGRKLRPGCGTASYGAPEVWGHDESKRGLATPADVYAFGCLGYELLTGETLFEESHDLATITAHLQHDGMPAPVGRLTLDPRTAGFAEIIRRCIRRNPAERPSFTEIRAALQRVAVELRSLEWPVRGAAA